MRYVAQRQPDGHRERPVTSVSTDRLARTSATPATVSPGADSINGPLQGLLFSADRNPLAPVRDLTVEPQASWLRIPAFGRYVGAVAGVRSGAPRALLAGAAGLAVRYRRGDEKARRQLLWLLLAATITVALVGWMRLSGAVETSGYSIIMTSAVALVPVSMAVAVLRYQLLDIRLVWSRTVTYLLLTAGVAATYLRLVWLVERLLQPRLSASVLATLVVAIGFNPVRVRLQRLVDRLFYGDRADPVRAASSVAAQLAGASQPGDVLPAVCAALRLPYAALADSAGATEGGARDAAVVAGGGSVAARGGAGR
jgi:two-component system NarL family sensor kinase